MLQLLGGRAVTHRLALVAAVLIGCAVGCAGRRTTSSEPPAAEAPAGLADPRAEIEALDREISDALARAHLAPPATATCSGARCAAAMSQPFTTPVTSDPACRPARSDRCTDACTIATSICGNQDKICALARQLAGDDWAANKCAAARASCQAAHDRCCSCVL